MQVVGRIVAVAWFLTCAVGGAFLLNLAFDKAPQTTATYFPVIVVAWVTIGFLGRAGLEKVFAALYRPSIYQMSVSLYLISKHLLVMKSLEMGLQAVQRHREIITFGGGLREMITLRGLREMITFGRGLFTPKWELYTQEQSPTSSGEILGDLDVPSPGGSEVHLLSDEPSGRGTSSRIEIREFPA